jgi:hypothetical protein
MQENAALKPNVKFRDDKGFDRILTDQEIGQKLAEGAVISNTAFSIYRAKKRGFPTRRPEARVRPPPGVAVPPLTAAQAVEISDPNLTISDESAIAINPQNPMNIVAGAVTSYDGQTINNSAFVTLDGGVTWKTVTAIADTDEGAGIAFDDSGNCYYTTLQGGFQPCCAVSKDGGLTWGQPAFFGQGDKTAVAARGQIALCGFDRINTEACAFTLDGGANWTVVDFNDSGLGTGPLVSYDETHFYIIYGALDGNLKIYVSADQGSTWSGPQIVVAGNAFESAIGGPLTYEGFALTSPGTNVAVDGTGTLHVLYIDSNQMVPMLMYTSSVDHGSTWSTPVNVDSGRSDPHMWPCLSSNRNGDLVGGSLVYDQTLGQYIVLLHLKRQQDSAWTTVEADNGPFTAAGPSPGFRIGFGDYFDCDLLPVSSPAVMAWSETANGQQPWQTWARVREVPMTDCGLNLPCAQEVSVNQQIAALQISNIGIAGSAIKGTTTQSPDPAVVGEIGVGVIGGSRNAGVGVQGIYTGTSLGEFPGKIVVVQGICTGLPFGVEGIGIEGQADASGVGVSGENASSGPGVQGTSSSGAGVAGSSTSGNGIVGSSTSGNGIFGSASGYNGVAGHSDAGFASGVYGENFTTGPAFGGYGVAGRAGTGGNTVGVLGDQTGSGYAGYFNGKVHITQLVNTARSGFQIDHPLEPDSKYLNHSAVESSDMKNVYDGIATLDSRGCGRVELPAWFEALNQDFRYQLTPIGSYSPVYVAQEIVNNQFQIAGGNPGQRISWLVTGIRRDVWAERNPIAVEEHKDAVDRGKFLHPHEAGHPEEMGIPYSRTRGLETLAEHHERLQKSRLGGSR